MKYKKALIIGSNGMLGQAFSREFEAINVEPIGIARKNANYCLDLKNFEIIPKIINESKADVIINCAGIVSLKECEAKPLIANKINAELVDVLAENCLKFDKKFIHISTDHFYINDKKKLHKETDDIKIVNQYAKTKRVGEINALKNPDSIVIRTNITGIRGNISKPTFFEWLYSCLIKKSNISLFNDFYTSTISAELLAKYTILISQLNIKGLINIASSECISKKDFALLLAKNLSINFDWYENASVKSLQPNRADSLGLDCSKVENILQKKMPKASEVINNLVKSLKKNQS